MTFHLSDLLFWAKYYRTAQDIGPLTIAVGQWRPVWINQTCTVQRQYLSQTSRESELETGIHTCEFSSRPCGFELKTGIHTCEFSSRPCGFELKTGIHTCEFSPRPGSKSKTGIHTCEFNSEPCFYFRGWQAQGKANQGRSSQKANSRMTKNWSFYSQIVMWLSCD